MQSSEKAKLKHAAGINAELFKALASPLRGRLMVVLSERVAGAPELAELLGETVENISYHLREMRKVDLIEEIGQDSRRRRFYKASARPLIELEAWETLPQLLRELNSVWVGQLRIGDFIEAINDMIASMEAQTFDARPGRTMIRFPMVLDEEGWDELEPAAMRYMEELYEIQARSDGRRSKSGEEGINVSASALAFEMPSRAAKRIEG